MKPWIILISAVSLTLSGPVRSVDSESPVLPATAETATTLSGVVTRASFTSDIRDHEPVDRLTSLTNDHTRIVYFTEIKHMAGLTVRHRWEYRGEIQLEVPIEVRSVRWRAYSVKTLDPSKLGEWKASVVDAAGGSLSVNTFTYMKNPGTP